MKKRTNLGTIGQIVLLAIALTLLGIALDITATVFHWGDGDVVMCTIRDAHDGQDLWKNKDLLKAAGFQKEGKNWNKTFKGGCNLKDLDKRLIEAGFGIEKDSNYPDDITMAHNPPSEKGWASWPEGRKPVTKDPGSMLGSEWPIAIGLGVAVATLIGVSLRQRAEV